MSYQDEAKQRATAMEPKITRLQLSFLEILLNDCGYGTRLQRMDFVSGYLLRKVAYLDELTGVEAKKLISALQNTRREINVRAVEEDD